MSLYQIMATMIELGKRHKPNPGDRLMTEEEFEAGKQAWRDLGLKDVRV